MSTNKTKEPDGKKAKKERDKRAKGKDGLGRLFKGGYYLLKQKRNNDG